MKHKDVQQENWDGGNNGVVNSPFLVVRIAMGYFVRFLRPLIKTNVIDFDIFRETREMFAFLAFITDPKYFLLFLSVVKIIFIKDIHEPSFIGILNDET